jgi:hypothetical protein
MGNGDRIYPLFQHSPSHRNVFHGPGGVPSLDDDPTRIWAEPIVIQAGSTAARTGFTSGAIADNKHSPNGKWGWFGEFWHPELYDSRQGQGKTVSYRKGTSDFYVTWSGARKRKLYLEAPVNGTGIILRPMKGGGGDARGLKWDSQSNGTFRCRWRGPHWLKHGHPLGAPLGAEGYEEWVWWGDTPPGDVADWYPIPEVQLICKPSIDGLRSLDHIHFGGATVPSHAEYIFSASPMPNPDGPTLLQNILDLGANWGHARNVIPSSPNGYKPRKAEGIKISITEQFRFPLDGPSLEPPPVVVVPDPPPVVIPEPEPEPEPDPTPPVDEETPDVPDVLDMDTELDAMRALLAQVGTQMIEALQLVDEIDDTYGDGVEV